MKLSDLQFEPQELDHIRAALVYRLKNTDKVGVGNRIQNLIDCIDEPSSMTKKKLKWSDHCNICNAYAKSKWINESVFLSMFDKMVKYQKSIGFSLENHWKLGNCGVFVLWFVILFFVTAATVLCALLENLK